MSAQTSQLAALPRSLHAYVGGVVVVAAGALILLARADDEPRWERLPLMLTLAAVLVVEHLFEGRIARQSGQRESFGHEESFLVAMLLLSSSLIAAVTFAVGVLAGNLLRRREPIKVVFNVAAMIGAGSCGLLLATAIAGAQPGGARGAAAAIAGSAVFLVLNSSAVSGALTLARGAEFRHNLLDDARGKALLWAGNTAIGLLAGLAAAVHLWTLPFGLAAMFTLHYALAGHARARAEQQKLEDIVGSSSDGILSVDERGAIVSWNPACESITGYAADDAVGKPLADMFGLLELTAEDRTEEAELVHIRTAAGETRWLALTSATLPEGGTVIVLRDETSRKRLAELDAARERDRLTSDLVAAVSHELRTPLTSILGFTQTLLTREVDARGRRDYLEIVQAEATRLAELIDDLLDIRRLSEERLAAGGERIDLGDVLAKQAALFAGQSKVHEVRLELPDAPLWVIGRRDRLSQAVSNLISNAIKYSPAGGTVTVSAEQSNGVVRAAVEDDGLGIPPGQREKLFTPFFRVDTGDRAAIPGSGLGLALARESVEAHGGTIGFESEEGSGSTFWFELPWGSRRTPRSVFARRRACRRRTRRPRPRRAGRGADGRSPRASGAERR